MSNNLGKNSTRKVTIAILLGILIAFIPSGAQAQEGNPIDTGDTAWMIVASLLVLLILRINSGQKLP